MENGIPFRKGITPQNIKKCGWSMKKERGFYQKPRSFALFGGISAVFPAGQAVGRVGMLDDVARQGEQGDGVGMTMSWLSMSLSSQTRSLDIVVPRKMKISASSV